MEVSARHPFRLAIVFILLFFSVFFGTLFFHSPTAQAYDEYSHEWITRSAMAYLQSNPHVYPETKLWVEDQGQNEQYLEELLVRSVVDTDYHDDIWLGAWFHASINGGESDDVVAMFTTMFHFLTVIVPGRYWQYDGYSYHENTHEGNDKYLNEPTVQVDGSESPVLGGTLPDGYSNHGADLGVYDVGFRGDRHKWRDMFFGANAASDAFFPPSYVPATIAYQRLIESPRASSNSTESWTAKEHLVTGIFSNTNVDRQYWRGQVEGLPEFMDLLGMVIHLEQDTTVPHHVEDTSDRCHSEYERAVDQLACNSPQALDYSKYYDGTYADGGIQCGSLYDPALVSRLITEQGLLDPSHPLPVSDRMIQSALLTAQWDWRIPSKKTYATLLPDGRMYESDNCQDILSEQAVQEQAKYQFNLAVAETVSLFEQAAHDYETRHAGETAPAPLAALSWLEGQPAQ